MNFFCKSSEFLKLRDSEYFMFSAGSEEELASSKKGMVDITENSVLGKVFGYFFDK